jgi:hypothetical protein
MLEDSSSDSLEQEEDCHNPIKEQTETLSSPTKKVPKNDHDKLLFDDDFENKVVCSNSSMKASDATRDTITGEANVALKFEQTKRPRLQEWSDDD